MSRVSAFSVSAAFAIPGLDHGGPDKVFFDVVRHLDPAIIAPRVAVAEPDGFYLSNLPAAIPIERLATPTMRLIHRYPVTALARFVRAARPQVVVTTLRMNETALMGKALRLWPRSTRLIIRPASEPAASHADLRREHRRVRHQLARHVLLRTLRFADAIICQSEQIRSEVAELGLGEKATVIGNGIDAVWLDEQAAREPTTAKGSPALIAVGRLTWLKGFDLLLPTVKDLQRQYPALHLTIVGEGPERERLEALIAELGIRSAVSLIGFVANPFGLMRSADLLVCSSRFEGLSNVMLEALALGTPVVAVRSLGGAGDAIRDGFNGFLAASPSAHDLQKGISEALRRCERSSRHDISGDARSRFDIDATAGRYAALIAAVAERRSNE